MKTPCIFVKRKAYSEKRFARVYSGLPPKPSRRNNAKHRASHSAHHALRFTFFIVVSLFVTVPILSQEESSPTINLAYTTNLNCALDDCHCSGNPVGGMTRVLSCIENLRSKNPDLLLVDSGDFLMSYTLPEANLVMLQLMALARYSAINLGDQAFVESPGFIFDIDKKLTLKLPLLSANLTVENSASTPYKVLNINGIMILIIGMVDQSAFSFISPNGLSINSPEPVLAALPSELKQNSGLQILLFHGEWKAAQEIVKKLSWIDVVILGHTHKKQFKIESDIAFAECGSEGEYIGHLRIQKSGDRWRFKNEFIAINDDILFNPEAQKLVNEYYQSLE